MNLILKQKTTPDPGVSQASNGGIQKNYADRYISERVSE